MSMDHLGCPVAFSVFMFVTSNCAKFRKLWYVQTVLSCFCMAGCKLVNKDPNHKELEIVGHSCCPLSHNY